MLHIRSSASTNVTYSPLLLSAPEIVLYKTPRFVLCVIILIIQLYCISISIKCLCQNGRRNGKACKKLCFGM